MAALPTHLIDSILEAQGDSLDAARASLVTSLQGGNPGARKAVFDFANQHWATVATEAWNEGERSPRIMTICRDVQHLCDWVAETPREEGEESYDAGGAVTTAGMMLYVLGDTEGALKHFHQIIARPVNSYFHESTHEKLISTLIKEDRTHEALAAIDALLGDYPHNAFGKKCREAYEADQASGAADGAKLDMDAYGKVTTALSTQFSTDMENLMAEGLSPAELQVRMNEAQKAFQSAMELLSRLV